MILLIRLIGFVDMLLSIYMWVVIASAVITWVSPDPRNHIVRFLRAITEAAFQRIRKLFPTNFGGMDIAPLLLLLSIQFVRWVLIDSLTAWLSKN